MKSKTSITLSPGLLDEIDRHEEFRSRSEFIEAAVRRFVEQLARGEADRRDLAIINRRAEALNDEAKDVLSYQVPL